MKSANFREQQKKYLAMCIDSNHKIKQNAQTEILLIFARYLEDKFKAGQCRDVYYSSSWTSTHYYSGSTVGKV